MINLFKLIKYTWYDFRNKDKKEINGIYCFCGLYGMGKTLSMVNEAHKLHKKGYNVYSNIGITFQQGHIMTWQDVINVPPNSVICLDEISNLINSRDWKNMPPEFFGLLTQNRKLNIRIMTTAQVFDDVDKQMRTLVRYVVQCSRNGRILSNKYYDQIGYNHAPEKRRSSFSETYVIENYMYDLYDTFEYVQKLKKEIELKKMSW